MFYDSADLWFLWQCLGSDSTRLSSCSSITAWHIFFRGVHFSGVNTFQGWIFVRGEHSLGVNIFRGEYMSFAQFTWSSFILTSALRVYFKLCIFLVWRRWLLTWSWIFHFLTLGPHAEPERIPQKISTISPRPYPLYLVYSDTMMISHHLQGMVMVVISTHWSIWAPNPPPLSPWHTH